MKNITLLFATVLVATNFTLRSQTMPLYLNFNSHNEISDNITYSNAATWSQYRGYVLTLADTFAQHGVKWNLQAESDFIRGEMSNENAYTNPNDLLDSLDASPTVEVDPHNHFDNNSSNASYNPYNYSDLAHLLDSAGLTPSRNNMGGFLWTQSSDFMPYQNPVAGNTYPTHSWNPNVIWGAGSPGHTNDYNGYGVWKPGGSNVNFFTHTSSNHLTYIGNGCSLVVFDTTQVSTIVNQVEEFLTYIQYQPYNSMNMYTASIQMNFRNFSSPGYLDTIAAIVQQLQPYVNSGQIVYQTLTEKYNTWYAAHTASSDHFILDCSGLPLNTDGSTNENSSGIYPNPATASITFTSSTPVKRLSVYDAEGNVVLDEVFDTNSNSRTIDIAELTSGIYFVIGQNEKGERITSKLMKQ